MRYKKPVRRETHRSRLADDDPVPLDEAEPAPHVGRHVRKVSVDDGEQENRVRGVQPIEQPFDRGPDRFANGSTPGDERRDEENRRFVALGFDEELNARRLHRPSRV
jgi:hypothetical protein